MFDDHEDFRVSGNASFKLDLFSIARIWISTLHRWSEELPPAARDYLAKLTPAKADELAETLAEAISTEIVTINGSTELNRYHPVLQFEVSFDLNAIADSFWAAIGMEYEGNDRKWLLPPKVAKAFAGVEEGLWHQVRPDLLDALESDFRVYLRIEDY